MKKINFNTFPIVTIFLCAIIFFCNIALVLNGKGTLFLDEALVNEYSKTWENKEYWRVFTSWVPHLNTTHLSWDLAYLLAVGVIVEMTYGRFRVVFVFLFCSIIGSVLSTAFDTQFLVLLGSSAGTYGLAAYFCLRQLFCKNCSKTYRILCFLLLSYLFWLTTNGLFYGNMGWPLEFFNNSGYDHLGGIAFALLIAVIEILWFAHNKTSRT